MNYIVMDLEFNQPFDFERGEKAVPVEHCPFEIIQIGIVKLDDNFNVVDTLDLLIKPQLYKRMHPYVERITGISSDMLEGQSTFPEIYDKLMAFAAGEDAVICVWGSTDITLLFKNILFYKLDASCLTKKFLNVQQLASRFLKLPGGMNIGLRNAVESLEIPIASSFHDALNDADYTARILKLVATKDMPVCLFDPDNMHEEKKDSQRSFDSNRLFAEVERLYGRQITKKEKAIIKKVYIMGRLKRFDFKKIKKTVY